MSSCLTLASKNRELIDKILEQFVERISHLNKTTQPCGLLNGLAGELLFLFKLSQFKPTLVNDSLFHDKLEYLQQQLPNVINQPDLSTGLSGQGWFLEFINQAQGADYDSELCEDIDDILLNSLSIERWQGEVEMVKGLGGIAMYAARRQLISDCPEFFEKIVSHFESTATQVSENTLSWAQPTNSIFRFNKENPNVAEYNLGLAHGVPSIIAAILPALKIPTLFERTKRLLIQSCDWLLQQELDAPQSVSCFASSCNDNNGSRLGWCYGDLTIALTLARVGKALELPSYVDKAKKVSLHAAKRNSSQGMVYDAGLCHGSAGLALIFQLLHQQFDEPKLLQAANKWLLYTLDLYREKGLEGFYMYSSLTKEYQEDSGFLMGYSGIGLCLLAALGEQADWTDCLLMS